MVPMASHPSPGKISSFIYKTSQATHPSHRPALLCLTNTLHLHKPRVSKIRPTNRMGLQDVQIHCRLREYCIYTASMQGTVANADSRASYSALKLVTFFCYVTEFFQHGYELNALYLSTLPSRSERNQHVLHQPHYKRCTLNKQTNSLTKLNRKTISEAVPGSK
jgi:hypothetical protein